MGSMSFVLAHDLDRDRAMQAVKVAPMGFSVEVSEPTRTVEQNAALWPLLAAFSAQKQWPVNGALMTLSAWEWKDLLSASFANEQMRMSPLIGHAGMVMLGLKTSGMKKKRFSDFLEFIHSAALELGVDTNA